MTLPYIIAIDGLAASGKSTLTKNLANKLGFDYLLTGNLYRLVAQRLLINQVALDNIEEIIIQARRIDLNIKNFAELTSSEISETASIIATYPELREELNHIQRNFANKNSKGIIVEGRDIGTVIFPKANIKLFISANLQARSNRRYKELLNKGFKVIYNDVFEDLKARDERDSKRSVSPLMMAEDAIEVDTSDINSSQLLIKVLDVIKQKSAINRN
ncbi:Cytidylate kinase [Candidatus Arcanobacter lacustris]|uniref:Cytidylate kinase n=1 Tax=Candidatus Arcanibacter lacustris TaxID=1607817 RepID=A0A0F5MQA1_9RICK|nr:Cytidylate kinase [Candidatus Arcanobacter lacustris]